MPRVDSTTESRETRLARAVKECMLAKPKTSATRKELVMTVEYKFKSRHHYDAYQNDPAIFGDEAKSASGWLSFRRTNEPVLTVEVDEHSAFLALQEWGRLWSTALARSPRHTLALLLPCTRTIPDLRRVSTLAMATTTVSLAGTMLVSLEWLGVTRQTYATLSPTH